MLTSKQGVIQSYVIEVNMPLEYLAIASDHLPMTNFEKWQLLTFKSSLFMVAFFTIIYVANDVFHHLNFSKRQISDHEDTITALEE